jgi:altronate dehydratase small subunit
MAKIDAIVMKPADNVCTVLREVAPATGISVLVSDEKLTVTVTEAIPFGHKFALKAIKAGEPIIKYGEIIGLATRDIQMGQYVHVHNLESCRGRGDK